MRDQPLPVGKEWLARGTAVYGGGSVLDVGVSISGDSLYYLPTHEINAGVALIAYRMKLDGVASKISAFLSPEVGRFLGLYVGPLHRQLMDRYVDYHRPVWWLALNSETMMRNECPYEFPTMSAEVFAARSLILSATELNFAASFGRSQPNQDSFSLFV